MRVMGTWVEIICVRIGRTVGDKTPYNLIICQAKLSAWTTGIILPVRTRLERRLI